MQGDGPHGAGEVDEREEIENGDLDRLELGAGYGRDEQARREGGQDEEAASSLLAPRRNRRNRLTSTGKMASLPFHRDHTRRTPL